MYPAQGSEGSQSNQVSLIGPLGYGDANYVPFGQPLPYTVNFENNPGATTTVGEIRIVTELDDDLDPRTFELGDLRIGDIEVNIPSGRGTFQGDFDFSQSKGFILRVSAGLDILSNTAIWMLQAIDPRTGEVITDPDLGLLPPNDSDGAGVGFASYIVRPLSSALTGAEITTTARVLFDQQAPLDTETSINLLDGRAPISTLEVTKLSESGEEYLVQWGAVDDEDGSGVRHVTVYVAEDGGDFKIWQAQSTAEEAIFEGEAGHTYEFLALATDNAGNRKLPQLGITPPEDGFTTNLGTLPEIEQTTEPPLLPPPASTGQTSTNELFVAAQAEIPNVAPNTQPSEFAQVLRPFSASAFATGIAQSHGDIGPMAILELADGSVLASGGQNRGSLYRFDKLGGEAENPLAILPYPIFDMAVADDGSLWATTGGGPLLKLDVETGEILEQYADGITQTLAIAPTTGEIYLSSGNGIEIFDPSTETFSHFSDLRVGNLTFAPDGTLWATRWPQRGEVVRFNEYGEPQQMLSFDAPTDSLTFGQTGTELEGLLFVSTNSDEDGGELLMVDTLTLDSMVVASGGSRGDVVKATADGRLLLSQSEQIDVLLPVIAPEVAFTNPSPNAIVALPQGSITVTFDQDMFVGDSTDVASVLNPNNFILTGEASGTQTPDFVRYDAATRSAVLEFGTLAADNYGLDVLSTVESAAGLALSDGYEVDFTAVSDFSAFVDIDFSNTRYDRANQTQGFKNARFRVTLSAQNRPSSRRSLSLIASVSKLSGSA